MARPSAPVISARKKPRQARSADLVAAILEAALRVLARDGAARFTTVHVADEAGVSVGSLYQYFPNKTALLFRLQADEWEETWAIIDGILRDARQPPLERLERAVVTFFRSEREESTVRRALMATGARLEESTEWALHETRATTTTEAFVAEVAPELGAKERARVAETLLYTLTSVAETFAERDGSRAQLDAAARETSFMLRAYLERRRG